MSERKEENLASELWQHEVEGTRHWFQVDRRGFLQILGGGIVVVAASSLLPAQESGRGFGGRPLPQDIASWLHIAEDGRVTVYTGKVEMGQNIRTSLAQAVAEELRVDPHSITMVMGDTDLTPYDMGTFGSRTTPTMAPQLRAAAAAARETLIDLAAQKWNVTRDSLIAAAGKIALKSSVGAAPVAERGNESITYGQLTRGQKLVKVINHPALLPAKDWQVAGKPLAKINGRDFVTGKHVYPSDFTRPGMLHGKLVRPTQFEAKLVTLDTSAAEKIPGVKIVHDNDLIGVVAPDLDTAERAVRKIKAQWQAPQQPSNENIFEYLKRNAEPGSTPHPAIVWGGSHNREKERPDTALAANVAADTLPVKLEATYTVQYIAHAPLEPRAAVAEWNGDKVTVWTGSQRPFAIRDELAQAFNIPTENVRVLIPDTGSGYGGKHTGDAAVEAARLAKAAGKPVKLTWTRDEEFTWAYRRPAGVIEVRSGARKDGTLVAWEFHNYNSGPAGIEAPYNIQIRHEEFHKSKSPLRQGSYRALAATANNFARESHMDELAHALNMDPLEFRLKNTTDDRLKAVLQAAAEKFGWGKQKPSPQRGFGVACGFEKGGHVATCAEVAIDPATRAVRIVRVVEAFETGAVVNPNGIRNQIMGAIVQGIGGAMFESVLFNNGRILNPHFANYRVPRFADVPEIEIVVLDRKDLPSAGAGETPIIGLAPAVADAIFVATGQRLRGLPLVPNGLPPKSST